MHSRHCDPVHTAQRLRGDLAGGAASTRVAPGPGAVSRTRVETSRDVRPSPCGPFSFSSGAWLLATHLQRERQMKVDLRSFEVVDNDSTFPNSQLESFSVQCLNSANITSTFEQSCKLTLVRRCCTHCDLSFATSSARGTSPYWGSLLPRVSYQGPQSESPKGGCKIQKWWIRGESFDCDHSYSSVCTEPLPTMQSTAKYVNAPQLGIAQDEN